MIWAIFKPPDSNLCSTQHTIMPFIIDHVFHLRKLTHVSPKIKVQSISIPS